MSLQLYLGCAGSGKSYQMYKDVVNESIKNPGTDYLVIVPEQFTLQTQKDIVSMHPDNGVMNIDILSFMRFAYRIFDEVGHKDLPVLEDTGKSMVVRRVAADKRKNLTLYRAGLLKPGMVNELKSFISELYQYNIKPEDFNGMLNAAEGKPLLLAKLKDILVIYEGFAEYMRQRYITAEEILIVLKEILHKSEWLKNSVICLDGFTGFTPCQNELLAEMMKYAKKVMVAVTIDGREDFTGSGSEHTLFGLSVKTINKLYSIARDTNTAIEPFIDVQKRGDSRVPYRFLNSKALAFLENNLFRYPYKCFNDCQNEISLHAARDAEGEVNFVVREIRRLVMEEGYRYRDIAIVTGDMDMYGRIIKRRLSRAGIPCFIDYKKEILDNPFAELIRAAIAITAEDFSYESVMRYLRTGLSDIPREDADLLENYIIATGLRGNKRYREAFTRQYRSRVAASLETLNMIREKLLGEILPLYEVLKDREKTVVDYIRALYDFGIRLDIERKLKLLRDSFTAEGMLLEAKEYEQVYRIIMDLYDQTVLLLGMEHLSLKEFAEIVDTGLMEARVGLIPPGIDEIVAGDTQRTRLKDIRALFLIGANEGIIPKAIGSGGILSDMERELLSDKGIELAPTRRQRAFTEQFYIYLNMTKPSERLYITYHKTDDEGRAVNPSYVIGKLRSLFPKTILHDEDAYKNDPEHILGDAGISYLASGLRSFSEKEPDNFFYELLMYYRSRKDTARILNKLIGGAFHVNKDKGIGREAARQLYGPVLSGSVTRLEEYSGCAYAHFLSYGLNLEERQEYKLAVPDIGNIFHNSIDAFSKRLDESAYTWHDIPDDVRQKWAIESVADAVDKYENSCIRSTKRDEYLIRKIERITVRTLWALCSQIRQGVFEPAGYEMPFSLVPDSSLHIKGRIDRMDLYEAEDKVYVRVVDYKTGSTYFDIGSIYHGLQQQLAVYLSAAMDYLKDRYKDKKIIPSGIFYYHIDDPIVEWSDKPEEDIFKSLRMNGLVNGDKEIIAMMDNKLKAEDGGLRTSVKSDIIPVEINKSGEPGRRSAVADSSQLNALLDYVNKKLINDTEQILEGDVRLYPYRSGSRAACDYCPYKGACGFDERLPGYTYHNLAKRTLDEMKEAIYGMDEGPAEGN